MEGYFGSLGDKACCFEDLKPYLGLNGEDLSRWSKFLEESLPTACVRDL